MAEEAKWYIVHTYSGYENKVKANIEKSVENRGIEHLILDVEVPLEDVIEEKNGEEKVVKRKIFPGYVIIKMIMNTIMMYLKFVVNQMVILVNMVSLNLMNYTSL